MRQDLTTLTNTLHYCQDGSCFFRFSYEKNEYLIPLIVVAYACASDYMRDQKLAMFLCGGDATDNFLGERVQVLQQNNLSSDFSCHNPKAARQFLGAKFRDVMGLPKRHSDAECGDYIVRKFFLVHARNKCDKFHTLMYYYFMIEFFALVFSDSLVVFCC